MSARARPVRPGLGHESRQQAVLAADLLEHETEEGEAVRRGQRVGVGEVDLPLAVGVFVVERIYVPAESVHGTHDFVEPGVVVKRQARVVGGFVDVVELGDRDMLALLVFAQHEEFALDADVEGVAHLGGGLELALEDQPAVGFEGFAFAPQVAGEPAHLGVPRQDGRRFRIGVGGDLLVLDHLGNAVQRRARAQLRARHHAAEMLDRHGLALRDAVHVDIGRDQIAYALFLEAVQECLVFLAQLFGHGRSSPRVSRCCEKMPPTGGTERLTNNISPVLPGSRAK